MIDRSEELANIEQPKTFAGRMSAKGGSSQMMSGILSGIKSGLEGITGNTFSGGLDALHDRKMQEAMRKDDIKTMEAIRDQEFMKNYDIKEDVPGTVKHIISSFFGFNNPTRRQG